jgi:hypothetical protein
MWYNAIIQWILQSPLHVLLSGSSILLKYNGRVSGKAYTVPVNYFQDAERLTIVSVRSRTWWRNFREGLPVRVVLQRRERNAFGKSVEDEGEVAEHLLRVLRTRPQIARYFHVALDDSGRPKGEDVIHEASSRVIVLLDLDSPSEAK